MTIYERVTAGLQTCNGYCCKVKIECPYYHYYDGCQARLHDEALFLIKQQDAKLKLFDTELSKTKNELYDIKWGNHNKSEIDKKIKKLTDATAILDELKKEIRK